MTLTERLLGVANIGAEWVLWILIIMSIASITVIIQRLIFFASRRVSVVDFQTRLTKMLSNGEFQEAADEFSQIKTMETQVVAAGLMQHHLGKESVSELMMGALSGQKQRYEKGLTFLATTGSNAPFIGLFGTVLGIIQAFAVFDIDGGKAASEGIMAAISEALIATGVGLLVAIPAVIAFNAFKSRVKGSVSNTDQLVRVLLAYLSAKNPTPIVEAPEPSPKPAPTPAPETVTDA